MPGLGGLAAEIDARRVVAAQLTVNRRQADPIEREALTAFRDGRVQTSQALREDQGWEHHHHSHEEAIAAMAAAVLTDMDAYGPQHIAALAVTHADCEALADRIRADLSEQNRIGGPTLEGPGWSGPRSYQAGDRILLHANAILPDGRRLTNGSVATILGVSAGGLTILPDRDRHATCLREDFVTQRGPDGRPQLSHAWARTIDGVQGGTWDQVHLLATPALDRYRGYVGQSRSVCPTHTWNTIPAPTDDDHGGRLVQPHSTDADEIAAALARANPKTFAADHDPYRIEKAIREEQARHRAHLDRRPADVTERLAAARAEIDESEGARARAKGRLVYWQERHDSTTGLRRLSPTLRRLHGEATVNIGATGAAFERAEAALAAAKRRYEHVRRQQAAGVTFDRANQWRIQRIDQLQQQLDDHWTAATVSSARDGNPHAYGPQHLRTARQTLRAQIDGEPQLVANSPLATTVGDPVQALVDLDQAVTHVTLSPTLPPAVRHQVQPAKGPAIHIMHEHAAHLSYTQPAPTPSIQV